MKYIVFLHYFFVNLIYMQIIPNMISLKNNGNEYYSCVYYDAYKNRNIWIAMYSKLIRMETDTHILIEVTSRYRYVVYLKMVLALWKIKDNINLTIDNY